MLLAVIHELGGCFGDLRDGKEEQVSEEIQVRAGGAPRGGDGAALAVRFNTAFANRNFTEMVENEKGKRAWKEGFKV